MRFLKLLLGVLSLSPKVCPERITDSTSRKQNKVEGICLREFRVSRPFRSTSFLIERASSVGYRIADDF